MKTKKQKSLIVPALLFTFLGIFPLAGALFEINSINDTIPSGVILPLLVGTIFEIFGLYFLFVTIRYKLKPFEYYSMFLVEEIVPVNAENEEHVYNMCTMLDEALSAERVRQVEKALERKEESYVVLFKYCGKLNRNKILSGDLIKKKLFDSTFLYIAKSRKFIAGQFYSCDMMKYGTNFRIHVYEDDDFRKIETI